MSLRLNRRVLLQAGAFALGWPFAASAQAQNDPFRYAGADRMARLVAAAKKEGTLTLYSSAIQDHMAGVTAAFEKAYGIKVAMWRGGSEEILQRSVTEARGRRYDVDVMETAAPQIEAIYREKLLADVNTPIAADMIREATIPGRPWLPSRLILFTGAYNTKLIKPVDLPKSYEDLLNPKWKGKLGIEGENAG